MEVIGEPHDPPSLPSGKNPQFLFYIKLCGSRVRCGWISRKKNYVVPTRIRTQSIHHVASPYTDYKLSSSAWSFCFHLQGYADQDASFFHCLLLKIKTGSTCETAQRQTAGDVTVRLISSVVLLQIRKLRGGFTGAFEKL